ncbi:hypothetical protein [Nonomuraea sp. LPB2021202275-12-8]|uniref:hypothetical protein n=1 Tax=Nonomuraea sp. LPB2021202275-12-8 TaxID=3120159 RepID=UPI00300CDA2A
MSASFDVRQEIEHRVAFLADKLTSTGRSLVLGISGGVDSTTADRLCQLAVERARAAGHESTFFAMRLPYGAQADEKDAQLALEFVRPDRVLTVDVKSASDAALDALLAGGMVFRDAHHAGIRHPFLPHRPVPALCRGPPTYVRTCPGHQPAGARAGVEGEPALVHVVWPDAVRPVLGEHRPTTTRSVTNTSGLNAPCPAAPSTWPTDQRGRLRAASARSVHLSAEEWGTTTQSLIVLPCPEGSNRDAPASWSAAVCSGVSLTSLNTIAPSRCRLANTFPT